MGGHCNRRGGGGGVADPESGRMWTVASHPSILILSYSEASMLLRGEGSGRINGLISVRGLQEQPLEDTGVRHRLVLNFDDVEPPDPSDPLSFYRAWVREKW